MYTANIPAVMSFYGKSIQDQVTYATTMAPSLSGRIFGGPLPGPDVGAIVINETFLFTLLAVGFMSTLAVVRHTRQNEETGRSELIGSAVVGRKASLAAALFVAVGANIILSCLFAMGMLANDLPVAGSIGTAVALGLGGIIFAGVAAVTAQVAESARSANSMAAAVIGVAFLARAIGDSLGGLTADKLGIVSAWPSWLSPIGWAQQVHPFTQQRWWLLGLMTGCAVVLAGTAFYINARRDLGAGLLATRKGPAVAAKNLLSAYGLARHLQTGIFRGWAVGALVMGMTIGLVSKEFGKMLQENEDVRAYVEQLGGTGQFEDVYFAAMLALTAIIFTGYVIQALQRLRSEETGGQLEAILATSVSRMRWMLSHIIYIWAAVAVLMVLVGLSAGLVYTLVTDAALSEVWRITGGAVAQLPAMLVLAGLTVLCFGLLPRAVVALSWSAYAACLLIGQFGAVLKLPQAVLNLSPFTHLPLLPSQSIKWLPLVVLISAALCLTAVGIVAFRRRDITTA